MKKLFILVLAVAMTLTVFAGPQGGRKGMRGQDKEGMIFKLVERARVDLNLTADQNQKLDTLLKEMRDYKEKIMKTVKVKKQSMIEDFVSEDFNPEAMQQQNQAERDAVREEARKFMTAKIKQLHDLLTLEQRQKLVDIAKQKKEKMKLKGGSKKGMNKE